MLYQRARKTHDKNAVAVNKSKKELQLDISQNIYDPPYMYKGCVQSYGTTS